MASLTALVTGFASSVERTAVGGSAIARDVTKLATSIALHSLSLAITSKVIGATALVTSGRASTASKAATSEAAPVASTGDGAPARNSNAGGGWAGASQMSRLPTVIAATAGAGTAQAQGRTISLNVAQALAVVALLRLSGTRKRALV